jgi:hypothetical protein
MKLIWVHADCLHRQSPAYRAYPNAPSLFVWDEAGLQRTEWSLKRIGFIYECLLDLPVTIRKGDPVEEVRCYLRETGCEGVVTMGSPDPVLQRQAVELGAEVLAQEPLVETQGKIDLTRFSKYWRKVETALTGEDR